MTPTKRIEIIKECISLPWKISFQETFKTKILDCRGSNSKNIHDLPSPSIVDIVDSF